MQFKHVLLSGLLAAVAAVMLLTFVLPQTAEAGGHVQCWNVWCVTDAGRSAPVTIQGSRADALAQCSNAAACSQLNTATTQSSYSVAAVDSCKNSHNICR